MALWTPLNLGTKLLRWWSSLDAATITQSGGAVSQWNDKSGNGDNANTAVGSQQPTYSATGFPGGASAAITADGNSDVFNILGPTYSGSTGFTCIAAIQQNGTTSTRTLMSGGNGSAQFRINANQSVGLTRTNIADIHSTSATVSTGAHIIGWEASSGTSSLWIDGIGETQSATDPAFTAQQTLLLTNAGGIEWFSGAVGDIYLCQKLTTDERQKLEGYAAHARGLQGNLPVSHPYRSSAPTTDVPKTFYLKAAAASGSNMGSLQDGGTAPTRVANTGWNVGANPTSTPFALMAYGTIVPRANFVASSPQALGSGPVNTAGAASAWRTENAYTGSFAATQWAMTFAIRSTSGTAQRGNIKVRVWASTDPTGQTNKRELTPGFAFQGNALTAISTTVDNITSTEWTPDAVINLVNEYLFVDCEWRITTAGAATTASLVISDGAASNIVTSAFTPSAGSVGAAAGVATAAATGAATARAAGTVAGVATVAGAGASTARAAGSAAGIATAAAAGAALSPAAGSAAGVGAAQAIGAATSRAAGSVAGAATAAATGAATAQAAGSAAGTATASAQSSGGASAVGTAAGVATAAAVGRSTAAAAGASAGVATANAFAAGGAAAAGTAAGVSTASGIGAATARAAGLAAGVGAASAAGAARASAAGSAAGVATASATALTSRTHARNYVVAGVPAATVAPAPARPHARHYITVGVPALTVTTGVVGGKRSRNYIVAGAPVLTLAAPGVAQAAGTAAGTSTAAAVGRATAAAGGTATGAATASGTATALAAAAGSATGTSTATGAGAARASAAGVANGTATAVGTGAALAAATGSAAGTATAAATAAGAPGTSAGSAAGVATVTGVGRAVAAAAGSAAGVATADAFASQVSAAAGSAAGTATATAAGAALRLAAGTAAGTSTAAATGRALNEAVGVAAGSSTASAVGRSTARAAGVAAGTSTVLGAARGQGWGIIVPPTGVWTVIPPPGGEWEEAA